MALTNAERQARWRAKHPGLNAQRYKECMERKFSKMTETQKIVYHFKKAAEYRDNLEENRERARAYYQKNKKKILAKAQAQRDFMKQYKSPYAPKRGRPKKLVGRIPHWKHDWEHQDSYTPEQMEALFNTKRPRVAHFKEEGRNVYKEDVVPALAKKREESKEWLEERAEEKRKHEEYMKTHPQFFDFNDDVF